MSAREELQEWVDRHTPHEIEGMEMSATMSVDLARRVLAEMDAAHTWDGLMALVDEHYPTDIYLAGQPDNPERDPGPRILSLIREVDRLRGIPDRVQVQSDEWERDEAYHCINPHECLRCISFQRVVIRLRSIIKGDGHV